MAIPTKDIPRHEWLTFCNWFKRQRAGIVLVGMHWLFAVLAFHSSRFGRLINGKESVLVQEGKFNWDGMRKGFISKDDILESLRIDAHISDTKDVELAYLERNGHISIIPRTTTPKIVEVDRGTDGSVGNCMSC